MRTFAYLLACVLTWGVPCTLSHAAEPTDLVLKLTHPAGESPKVFTEGWVFGAHCSVKGRDLSDKVRWSGTGSFKPVVGPRSSPVFQAPGTNTITLTVTVDGKDVSRSFPVIAVSPMGYAALGDIAYCPADVHGCLGDPFVVRGPITGGSDLIKVRDRPAARQGDPGVHAKCCGSNTFTIVGGDLDVLIDGRPAARAGDQTKHCGGMGTILRPGQGEMTPAGTSENLKLNILLRIEGDTMVNHSVPWSPAQNRVNQPSRSGPYLKKDGVIVAVKGPTFSADFTNDYDYGKSFPSKIHLEGTFNATRTAIEALEITFNAERTTPGVREARQWSLAAQGIPLSTPGTKRIEFVVRADNAKDRPKGFQILRADYVSTRRDETRTDKGDTQASEFKEDQLRLDNVAVTLDLTFRAQ
jgi:uncharacterized Zn-binding protein involved in type VI secretion